MTKTLHNWLSRNGGPAIQLRLSALHSQNNVKLDVDSAASTLLNMSEVHGLLDYFNGFQTPDRDKKTLEHLIHFYKDTCIDNFFPLIIDMGFKAGIPTFDEKMAYVADIFKYLSEHANEHDYCYYYTGMLHKFFFMSGYIFPEVVESFENRLQSIHKSAKDNIFDIYQDESKLPKKPKIWTDVGVLKDELNPFKITAEKPLPTIYDMWALAYYADTCDSLEIMAQINDIVRYVLEPKFQKIHSGYGLLWVSDRRTYHACGWSPTLPSFDDEGHINEADVISLLDNLDWLSHFKIAHKSKWVSDCLNHLELFRTEAGTYIFPKQYLHKKYIDKVYLNEANMALKRNEREQRKRELVSTMKMVEIYNRIEL